MDGREYGIVKAWIEERGMGFITSPSGVDHFVHRSMLLDGVSLTLGATVSYVPQWDELKSKATADQVQGAVPPPAAAVQPWTAAPTPGQASGMVKAWIEARGMGFIQPEDGSGDFFVHRSDLLDGQSLINGTTVFFEPSWDPQKNKACAHKVTGAVAAQAGALAGPPVVTVSKDNLFIAGLPADATEERVWEVFGQYGSVTAVKVLPDNGSPTRVALVRFADPSQAEWVLLNLNGNVPQGMANVVQVKYHEGRTAGGGSYGAATMKGASPGSPYGNGSGKGWGNGKGWAPTGEQPFMAPSLAKKDKIRVMGLPPDTNHQGIREIMSQYGTVNHVIKKPDGAVICHMSDEETAQWIVDNLNGNIPQGLESVISVALEGSSSPQASAPGGFATGPVSSPVGWITGTVKHWVQDRGMGFLSPDGGGEDCFVHQTNLVDGMGLVVGCPVTFMRDWDFQKNKPVAMHVTGAVGGEGVGKGAGKFAEAKGKGKF